MSDKKFKPLCLLLTAIIILLSVYIYRDYRIIVLRKKCDILARSIAYLNNTYNFPKNENPRINKLLKEQGYSELQKVITEPTIVDTTSTE